MKFGKNFLTQQIDGGVYVDYKGLKKSLKVKCIKRTGADVQYGSAKDREAWKSQLWANVQAVDSSIQQVELALLAQLHDVVGANKSQGKSAFERLVCEGESERCGDFLAEVAAFRRDIASNLLACVKICKKYDKNAPAGADSLQPELCAKLCDSRTLVWLTQSPLHDA